jgi:hypothetical protein
MIQDSVSRSPARRRPRCAAAPAAPPAVLPELPASSLEREAILRRLAERVVAAFGPTTARFFASLVDECAADAEEDAYGAVKRNGADARC